MASVSASQSAASVAASVASSADSAPCAPQAIGAVYREGTLTKQGGSRGGRKNWKTRYFVLRQDGLFYYKDVKAYRNGKKPKGYFGFSGMTAVRDRVSTEDLRHFSVCGDDRTMLIRAASEAIRREWTRALGEAWASWTAAALPQRDRLESPPQQQHHGHRRTASSKSAALRKSESQLTGGGRTSFRRELSLASLMRGPAAPTNSAGPSRSASRAFRSADNLPGGGGGGDAGGLSDFQREVDAEVQVVAECIRRIGASGTAAGPLRRRLDTQASDLYNFAHDAAALVRRFASVGTHEGVRRAQLDLMAAVRNQAEAIEAAAAAASRDTAGGGGILRGPPRSESGCSMDLPSMPEGAEPPADPRGGGHPATPPLGRAFSFESGSDVSLPPPPPDGGGGGSAAAHETGAADEDGLGPPPPFPTDPSVLSRCVDWPEGVPLPPPPDEAPPPLPTGEAVRHARGTFLSRDPSVTALPARAPPPLLSAPRPPQLVVPLAPPPPPSSRR